MDGALGVEFRRWRRNRLHSLYRDRVHCRRVALQLVLMRVRRADKPVDADNGADDSMDGVPSFHQWAQGEFEAERGRLRAVEAALLILLPIAAAAIGMMAFGIEFQIVEHVLM